MSNAVTIFTHFYEVSFSCQQMSVPFCFPFSTAFTMRAGFKQRYHLSLYPAVSVPTQESLGNFRPQPATLVCPAFERQHPVILGASTQHQATAKMFFFVLFFFFQLPTGLAEANKARTVGVKGSSRKWGRSHRCKRRAGLGMQQYTCSGN